MENAMTQDTNEATRVMGAAGGPPIDRTMVAGAQVGAPMGAGATQMGSTVTCPVCRTNNSSLEAYCGECGFLLSSAPGQELESEAPDNGPIFELVENTSGRRFRLKDGVNIVGRENCDILLLDGTVSRRHAQVTIENGLVILMDLGSSNGTQVDGTRIGPNQPVPLANNSTIRFGNATMTVVAPTGAAEATIMAEPAVSVSSAPNAVEEQTLMAPAAPLAVPEAADSLPATPIYTPAPAASGTSAAVSQLVPNTPDAEPIYIGEGTITVGRRTGNDIVLTGDPYISGRHCDISCDASGCYLMDVGSTNGTQVNGARLEAHQKQLLLDGDAVTIGQTEYTFRTLEAPDEGEEAADPESPMLSPSGSDDPHNDSFGGGVE
jgi:pSer/pThr/pTyr-binding forkhead associated (FHA) protein